MNLEPLNTGDVKLYLDFISDGTGRVQIQEPEGFDGNKINLETQKGRYARDVNSVSGRMIFHSTDKEVFDLIKLYDSVYGSNAKINFIVSCYAVDTEVGSLDFKTKETDQVTFYSFVVTRTNDEYLLRKRKNAKVDLFSDTDLSQEAIAPVSTSNILLKALPTRQATTWERLTPFWAYTGTSFSTNQMFQNPVKNTPEPKLETSFSWFESVVVANNDVMNNANNFKAISAKNTLIDNKVKFENVQIKYLVPTGDAFNLSSSWYLGTVAIQFLAHIGTGTAPNTFTGGYNLTYTATYQSTYDVTGIYGDLTGVVDEYLVVIDDQEFDFPDLEKDQSVWTVFNLRRILTITDWVSGNVTISGTSIGIDSVVKGVRLNDAQKQVVLSASGNTVNAPRFENGGEHYDNFIFNGSMCRGIEDVKLNVTLENLASQLKEINGDYVTIGTETSFLAYEDFYTDNEIISIPNAPDQEFLVRYNDEYMNNLFTFNYKAYETDKDEENTVDSIHTKTQWNIPNENSTGEPKIEIDFIRDPNKIEFVRRKSVQTDPTTALKEDSEVFILDCVDLPAGTERSVSGSLTHNIDADTGNLKLLNDGTFNWGTLGCAVGDDFEIVQGENLGDYTIVSFDFTIIELDPAIGNTPNFNGSVLTKVIYEITTATYVNRTNEGFTSITGIENADNFSNLKYSIRRNLKRWESYLNTSMQDLSDGVMKNLEFINGGDVSTQLVEESEPLIENADIVKSEITPAILSNEFLNKSFDITWQEYQTIETGIRQTKGFIRTADNLGRMLKVYPRKYEWDHARNSLTIEDAEIRLESEFTNITTTSQTITINETGYDTIILGKIEYREENDVFTLYDKRIVPLIRPTHYKFFKINGTQFTTADDLSEALSTLFDE